jgi:hypothetical protein
MVFLGLVFLGECSFLLKQLLEKLMVFLGDCSGYRGGEKAPVTPHSLGRPSSDSRIDYLASSVLPCLFLQIAWKMLIRGLQNFNNLLVELERN